MKKVQSRRKKLNSILLAALFAVLCSACSLPGMEKAPAPPAANWTGENQTDGSQSGNTVSADGISEADGAVASGEENLYGTGVVEELEGDTLKALPETVANAAELVNADTRNGFYYQQLSEAEQIWYKEIYAVLASLSEEMILSADGNESVGAEGLDRVFQCVMHDHPELFFVDGYRYTLYTYGSELEKIGFAGTYTMSLEDKEVMQKQIDAVVEECLLGIDSQASDYEKVKYVYEYVIFRTSYNQQAADNQNICSVFIGKESVCQGYAKSVQYLLNKMGVFATLVIGTVHGTESHAWNLIQIDGEYYYLDATWGDASYSSQGEAAAVATLPGISYDYLCVTTEEMSISHTVESPVPMPECTSLAANYYVMEGAYFTGYDAGSVAAFFEKGYDEDKTAVTLKCADETVYHTFLEELITNQQIFHYLNSVNGKVAYAKEDDKLSLTFWLVNE